MHRKALTLLTGLTLAWLPCTFTFAEEAPVKEAPTLKQKESVESKAPKAEKTPAGVPVYYATILKELGLEGEQREKFIAKVRERQQAVNAWKKENDAKVKELNQQATDAKTKGDVAGESQAKKEVKTLNDELAKLEEEHTAQIHSVLTDEQRAKLTAYNAYTGLLRSFARASISDDQKAQIKQIVYAHAKEFGQLAENDRKGRQTLREKIIDEVRQNVLTPEQQAALPSAKKPAEGKE